MMGDGHLNYIVLAMLLMMVFILMNRDYFGLEFYLSWNDFLKPFAYGGFCVLGITLMINEIIRRIKDKKLLEMNIVPKADSLMRIQVWTYLFTLGVLVSIITYIEVFESIYIILYLIGIHLILALLSYNRLSHSQNAVAFIALSFVLLGCFYFLVDVEQDQIETKLNFERERYASTYYENTSSPFMEQYLKIEQMCLSNYQENEENVLVEEYFNARFDWMADKVYEEMMNIYSYSPQDQLAYEDFDEVYYSDDHCNLIARKDKQILHLYFEYPEKHDIEGIIQAYFNH